MTRKICVKIPAPEGSIFEPHYADGLMGQFFHLLLNGQAYLARVESATNIDPETIYLVGTVETPEEEPAPEPLELKGRAGG